MKWSFFAHALPEYSVLWHALEFKAFPLTPDLLAIFSRGGSLQEGLLVPEQIDRLKSDGFLIDDSADPEPCFAKAAEGMRYRTAVQSLYLILTTHCNLACEYCLYGSAQSGSLAGRGEHMSHAVALQAIELFAEETIKNDRALPGYWEEITFYGGEPLLNPEALTVSMKHIRTLQTQGRLWDQITFVLNTNGTVFTPRTVELLRDEEVRIHVSIDGPAIVHDRVRVLHSGKGSHTKVIEGLRMLHNMGVDFIPLLTITEANLDSLGTYIGWLCQEFGIRRYGLNLLMHTGTQVSERYGHRAAEAMLRAHEIAGQYGAADQMYENACLSFGHGLVVNQSCGGGRKLVVFPHGGIHACQALEASGATAMGQLPDFIPDTPQRLHWLERNRFKNPTCLACPAIGGCGGGCGASSYNAGLGIQGIDPNHCAWMLAVFRRWLATLSGRGNP